MRFRAVVICLVATSVSLHAQTSQPRAARPYLQAQGARFTVLFEGPEDGEQSQAVTGAPPWAAAAYDGTIRLPTRGALDHPEELRRVLAHELARAETRLPFARLGASFRDLSPDEARLAYAQSAAAARALLAEAGGPAVVTILRDLASGVSFQAAYERRLSLPFAVFLSSLESGP